MTKLLEKAIEGARAPLAGPQDLGGERSRNPSTSQPQYRLTAEQMRDIELALADEDRGEFATDRETAETWNKFGL
jgi:hypothetical protein